MATFIVILQQSGLEFDRSLPLEEQSGWAVHADFMDGLAAAGLIVLGGPLEGGPRVAHVVETESEDAVRAVLARDTWSETHLRVASIEAWTLRLRSASPSSLSAA